MNWFVKKFESIIQNPTAFVYANLGQMVPILQDDIQTEEGEISMKFLREVGIPQKPDPLLLLRGITFEATTSPLSTVDIVFRSFGLPPVKEISDNLCLNLIPNTNRWDKVSVIYIDVRDNGKIKRFTYLPQVSTDDKKIMFVNSSISQYIYTLAFSLTYWKNFPTNEDFDRNEEYFTETVYDVFFSTIHTLDSNAIPASEEEWGHKSQNSTYWTEFFEYFTV